MLKPVSKRSCAHSQHFYIIRGGTRTERMCRITPVIASDGCETFIASCTQESVIDNTKGTQVSALHLNLSRAAWLCNTAANVS